MCGINTGFAEPLRAQLRRPCYAQLCCCIVSAVIARRTWNDASNYQVTLGLLGHSGVTGSRWGYSSYWVTPGSGVNLRLGPQLESEAWFLHHVYPRQIMQLLWSTICLELATEHRHLPFLFASGTCLGESLFIRLGRLPLTSKMQRLA